MAKAVTLPRAATTAMQRAQRQAGMTKRAWRAQRKLTAMLPMLERYARAVLRDPKVKVHTTNEASSYTDGKNIYIQPPMMLGDDYVHEVGSCGTRGENKRLICPACDGEEIVMSLLYHEISHLTFGSFVEPEKLGRTAIGRLVAEWHPPQACDHGIEILEEMAKVTSYLPMVASFDPRLYVVTNALEDARVNAGMLMARPGTKAMLDARMHYLFSSGVEQPDGKMLPWSELPIDAQVGLGMLLASSNYHEHFEVFHPAAQEILADEILTGLAVKISTCANVHELMGHVADVWRRFQELGIMVKEKCVPPPPEPEDGDDGDKQDDAQDKDKDAPDEDEGPGMPGAGGGGGGDSPTDNDDAKGEGGDGDSGAGQSNNNDPTAGGGPGSASRPGSSGTPGGNTEQDRQSGGAQSVPDDESKDSGGGDRVQEERGSGDQNDDGPEGSSGSNGDDAGESSDGDDAGGDDPVGSEGDTGGGVADGETGEEAGAKPKGSGDEVGDGESSGAEHEGGTPGTADGAGEEAGAEAGSEGGDGGEDAGAEGDPLGGGGPDENDTGDDTANFTPATLEQLMAALRAGSLHAMFDDESTESFASGKSTLNEEPIDATEAEMWAAALLTAGMQAGWFDGPSEEVGKVLFIEYGENGGITGFNERNVSETDLKPPLTVVGPVVTKGRVAFSPNKRNSYETELKSGKINGRALRKIPLGHEAIFRKKNVARKRSYHVIITMDVSGSTDSRAPSEHYPEQTTLQMMQRSVFAQAEALNRLGISFEIYAHTAYYFLDREEYNRAFSGIWPEDLPIDLWLLQVKKPSEKWDDAAKQRMHSLRPLGGNLDGHTLQVMRKKADEASRRFTDVIICYYTDGAMPASNFQEEGDILKVETALCKRKGHHLLAVAAGTDSPKEWGFDTVRIDSDNDLPKVMAQLERTIM